MKKFFYFILLTTCILIQAVASPIETTRKKVGLVLSGGGAKGIAHIGALKVIEEVVHRNNYSKIIKPYNPKVSKTDRFNYFENYLNHYSYPTTSAEKRNLCLRFSVKFSVPYDEIVEEFKLAYEFVDCVNL